MSNERLAALMIEAGFLDDSGTIGRKRFARAVTESTAACRAGRTYSHTYVSRWLKGVTPRDTDTREAIREAGKCPRSPRRAGRDRIQRGTHTLARRRACLPGASRGRRYQHCGAAGSGPGRQLAGRQVERERRGME